MSAFVDLIKSITEEATDVIRKNRGAKEDTLNKELKKRLGKKFRCENINSMRCPGQDKKGDIAVYLTEGSKEVKVLLENKRRYAGRKYSYHELFACICCFKTNPGLYDKLVFVVWNGLEPVPNEDHEPLFTCFYTSNTLPNTFKVEEQVKEEIKNKDFIVIVIDIDENNNCKTRIFY